MSSLFDASDFSAGHDPLFEHHQDDTALIHEMALVETPSRIGKHTRVAPFSHIFAHTMIGDHCHIGHHVTIASGVMIGNSVRVMNNALLNSGVILEDMVYCGASTVFTGLERIRGQRRGLSRISPTLVKHSANLGPNTSIAAGVVVGRFAFVEAGSVVDGNIPDFALVWGNPMRLRGWRCECGSPLLVKQDTTECEACGLMYQRKSRHKLVQLPKPQHQRRETRAAD